MDFASSFVYVGQSSDDEIDETLLEQGLADMAAQELREHEQLSSDYSSEDLPLPANNNDDGDGELSGDTSYSGSYSLDDALAQQRQRRQQQRAPSPSRRGGRRRSIELAAPPPPPAAKPKKKKSTRHVMKSLLRSVKSKPKFRMQKHRGRPAPPAAAPRRVRLRKADTNVVSLSLGTLAEEARIVTGDPLCCTACGAYFSSISTLKESNADDDDADEDVRVWACDFCGNEVETDLMDEELPTEATVDYVIEAAHEGDQAQTHNVVFCVDTSGSMCVTTEVAGKVSLRGQSARDKEFEALRQFGDGSNQRMRGERRNVTYISRLQCVQAAVDSQVQSLARDSPAVHCGLVTFASDVQIVGDASSEPTTVAGDRLGEYQELMEAGANCALEQPVGDTHRALSDRVFGLTEGGQTALGPGLVTAASLASARPGSEVIVCTDGLANVGLGAIPEDSESQELLTAAQDDEDDEVDESPEQAAVRAFYEQIGEFARAHSVTINVVSIQGTDCRMEYLGTLADRSGGSVDIVNPTELTNNFGSILADPVIATNVEITFLIHEGLEFRNTEEGDTADETNANILRRLIGNVSATSDLSFEYAVRRAFLQSLPEDGATLPFQVQIRYTALSGMQCVRVITQSKAITRNRAVAEEHANVEVLAMNEVQHAARMVKHGDYGDARRLNVANQRLMARCAKTEQAKRTYVNWIRQAEQLDDVMRQGQQAEYDAGVFLSDSEGDDDLGNDVAEIKRRKEKKMKKKKAMRSRLRKDKAAKVMYANKSISKAAFQ